MIQTSWPICTATDADLKGPPKQVDVYIRNRYIIKDYVEHAFLFSRFSLLSIRYALVRGYQDHRMPG
jgi:hypothetical protein